MHIICFLFNKQIHLATSTGSQVEVLDVQVQLLQLQVHVLQSQVQLHCVPKKTCDHIFDDKLK